MRNSSGSNIIKAAPAGSAVIEVFDGGEYRVYVDDDIMIFRPRIARGSALLLTPPGIKPQFYSVLAVLLTKSGIEVTMPRLHLPCGQSALRRVINDFLSRGSYGLVIMLGFDLGVVSGRKLVVRFSGDNIIRQLIRSNVPGSVRDLPPNDCGWVRDSIRDADLSIDEELPSLNTIVKIRDLALDLMHLGSASKDKNSKK